jgi:hypothetical protein
MLDEFLMRAWDQLVGRVTGPMALRFVIQPTMAAILAVRAGLNDTKAGRPPYFWSVLTEPAQRSYQVHEGWKDISGVTLMAVAVDVLYQLMVFGWVYPLQTLLVAFTLAVVPYLLIRGAICRIARTRQRLRR